MRKEQIPNLLTLFRTLAAPAALLIAVAAPQWRQLMFWIFVLASITDFFDGYLARKWNATSPLGTMLDPIADKLLVTAVLLYLVEYTITPLLAVGVIIAREIYISGLREFLALRGKALPVSKGGKWKTTAQLIAITALLAALAYPIPHAWNIGIITLWISAILTTISAIDYTRKALPLMRS